MMSKTNKELATDLVIAMLEHNAKLTKFATSSNPVSSTSVVNGKVIVENLNYIKVALDEMDD